MRSRTPDRLCAEAVDVAFAVTEEAAGRDSVGEHLGVVAEGDRVVTHLFACREPAYRGWRWATTLARASRAKVVTIDETVLLPGPDAVLAPEWVPWSERLRPGDLGPGDLLPTESDDLRLEPGWTGGPEEPEDADVAGEAAGADGTTGTGAAETAGTAGAAAVAVEAVQAGETVAEAAGRAAGGDGGADAVAEVIVSGPSLSTIGAVAQQLGLGRQRVLSRYGLHSAADRWEEQFGPKTPMAQAAPANCASCGFLVPIAGSLSQAFGVCANEFAPADGHLVSLGYGCGAHSEAAVMPKTPQPAPMVLDDLHDTDPLPLHPDRHSSVEDGEPSEDDLGHG
ncbi:Protein of unknown function [Actinacidiphila rubida]|uniref:DUF3027 domain-containing protein n=2 Tax=Actinacidiphila rubida TaxID=310780 RepID=A0A1H8DIN8_9ACTN|nr:DUF3027 domain-containing protein [Actinacidiphila rubida]SEN07083.1 Protein of unknown function [Actinacidiphila rubida]